MAQQISTHQNSYEKEVEEKVEEEEMKTTIGDLVSTLPKEKEWLREPLHLYQGFWYPTTVLQQTIYLRQHFKPHPNDLLLATYPKSGTTWLKALLFAIMNRTRFDFLHHPLLTDNAHKCVPFLEACTDPYSTNRPPLFATHIPYTLLPESILLSDCPIVYVFRDPKDTFVSLWHYIRKVRFEELPPLPLDEAFERFCRGASAFGPYWDHVLGYYKASLERPVNVLFLKYEDLKSDPFVQVKRLAEFSGRPFSFEEVNEGVVEKIVELCSFEKLSNLEVNKTGSHTVGTDLVMSNNAFFRQGKVGDWKNTLSSEMVEQMDKLLKHKFEDYADALLM